MLGMTALTTFGNGLICEITDTLRTDRNASLAGFPQEQPGAIIFKFDNISLEEDCHL